LENAKTDLETGGYINNLATKKGKMDPKNQ